MRRASLEYPESMSACVLRASDIMLEAHKRKWTVIGYGAGQFAHKLAVCPTFRAIATMSNFTGFFTDTPGRLKLLKGFPIFRLPEHIMRAHVVMLCTDTPGFLVQMQARLRQWKYKGVISVLTPVHAENPAELLRHSRLINQGVTPPVGDHLHLGCGANLIAGWINVDWLEATSVPPGTADLINGIYVMDATKPFPFADNQFKYIFCEDFIEHFDQLQGLHIVAECTRVLGRGGVWRISTPSFDRNLESQELNHGAAGVKRGAWGWGHKLLYSRAALVALLEQAGYGRLHEQRSGYSRYKALCNIDTRGHQKNIIIDAVKR